MSTTILTTTYRRPFLLKRLGDVIIPLLNKFDGNLKWEIVADEYSSEYDTIISEFNKKINNSTLINFSQQQNIGKFRTLINYLNKIETHWFVNIDDDDVIINFEFEEILKKLNSFDQNISAVLAPRLILNLKLKNFNFFFKKRLFFILNNKIISYFNFKETLGDIDSTIFIRSSLFRNLKFPEVGSDSFTAESMLWLKLFKKKEILFLNKHFVYSQYLSDGLTKSTVYQRVSNAKSATALYKNFLEHKKFNYTKFSIKNLINYYRFSFHADKRIKLSNDQYADIITRFLSLILAKLIFFYDKLVLKFVN
jgi:glycosyltransferase involved in cell wall biosynthesis